MAQYSVLFFATAQGSQRLSQNDANFARDRPSRRWYPVPDCLLVPKQPCGRLRVYPSPSGLTRRGLPAGGSRDLGHLEGENDFWDLHWNGTGEDAPDQGDLAVPRAPEVRRVRARTRTGGSWAPGRRRSLRQA